MRCARLARAEVAGAALVAVVVFAVASPGAHAIPPPGTTCPVFPYDNVWHADVSRLPVHSRSSQWIASMGGGSARLHPDFGPSGLSQPYGIPYDVVAGSHAKTSIEFVYDDESDPGPYPFDGNTTIEGGSDRHAIMIDKDNCDLYELFDARYSPSGSTAGSGAIFDLRSNALRPAGWTSADAAGLPIFAGLVRRDEVLAGKVDHAIRVTARYTDRRYVWPARHQAGHADNPSLPPMGARFRMKAGFDISGYRSDTRVILRAFKTYGMIVADNGSNWYFQGTSEDGWSTAMLDELKSIPASAFEAVDSSGIMYRSDSGRVRTKIRFLRIVYKTTDPMAESVVLVNYGTNPTSLKGWSVRDRDGNVYAFGSLTLGVRASVILHTRSGTNRPGHVYWNRSRPVWNDGGDAATLRNAAGTVMDSCSYSGGGTAISC